MKSTKLLFLMFFILLSISVQAQSKIKSVNTLEDKIYGLSLLWSEVKYNFVNIDRLDFNLDSLYRATLERVIKTEDDVAYYKEISCFLNRLNDAHTSLFDIPDFGCEETDYPNYGTKRIDGKYYFSSTRRTVLILIPTCLGLKSWRLTDCLPSSMSKNVCCPISPVPH